MSKIKGNSKANKLTGTKHDDTISGGGGNDTINGGKGDDTLSGGSGHNLFVYNKQGFGNDTITDFSKNDKIDLSGLHVGDLSSVLQETQASPEGALIQLRYDNWSEQILLKGVDAHSLTAKNFIFDTSDKKVSTTGTAGGDILFGAGGNDHLIGAGGNDTLHGGAGNDTLEGGAGNDVLVLGAGKDTVAYRGLGFGVDNVYDFGSHDKIDLSKLGIEDFSSLRPLIYQDGAGDAVIQFDASNVIILNGLKVGDLAASDFDFAKESKKGAHLTATGSGPELLVGTSHSDVITGGSDRDTLSGGDGNDTIIGGGGADRLAGGKGADHFVFTAEADSPLNTNPTDLIVDFSHSEKDKIDLSKLDGDVDTAGHQHFTFIGTAAFSGAAGEVRYDIENGHTVIYVHDDGPSNFAQTGLEITLQNAVALTAKDFILH